MAQLADRLEADLSRKIADLSTGNRQKVALIQAFMSRPELLILDEPSTGLDPLMQQELQQIIREVRDGGGTVFLSSHSLAEVERVADRVGILRQGRLVVVERVDTLKERAVRRLDLEFDGPVGADAFGGVAGVRSVVAHGHSISVTFEGSINALLRAALEHQVVNLNSREADLEEIFLTYYRADDQASGPGEDQARPRGRAPPDGPPPQRSMMLPNLLSKSVRDAALWTVAAAAILVILPAVAVPIYAEMGDAYMSLLEDMPDWMAVVYGGGTGTVAGLVGMAIFTLMAPLVLLVYAIGLGTAAAVGEEEARTLPLLLANPLSRTRLLVTRASVVAGGIVVIVVVVWLALGAIAAIAAIDMSSQDTLAAGIHLVAIAFLFGALSLALSAWTGSSAVGLGVASIAAVASYVAFTWLPMAPDLADLARLSPWRLYAGAEVLRGGLDPVMLGIALGLAVLLFAVALVGLHRRDLRA